MPYRLANFKDLRFGSLKKALAELPVQNANLDGEIVCIDSNGFSVNARILFAQHIEDAGTKFFREVCALDLEGIVAKTKHSVYRDGSAGWLKIKNRKYSQAEGRHELLTKGRRA